MGLAERRAIEQFKTGAYGQWRNKIIEAAGFEVPIEIDWDTLVEPGAGSSFTDYYPKVYFEPLVAGLKAITVDEMGKGALRGSLSKIVIRNTGAYYSGDGFSFEDGVLTYDQRMVHVDDNLDVRVKGLTKLLESKL